MLGDWKVTNVSDGSATTAMDTTIPGVYLGSWGTWGTGGSLTPSTSIATWYLLCPWTHDADMPPAVDNPLIESESVTPKVTVAGIVVQYRFGNVTLVVPTTTGVATL